MRRRSGVSSVVKMASLRMRPCVLSVLLLNVFYSLVSSLYFHIGETEKKCFIEEIPDETMIIGHYRMRDPPDIRIRVVAKDPDDKLVLAQLFGPEGTFYFTSSKPGAHQICMSPVSSRPTPSADEGDMMMLYLDIKLDKDTNNYTAVAAEQRLTELQLRVRQLTDQVQQIRKEQNYQGLRRKHFFDVSHSTNTMISWWPIARCLYMVAIFTYQTHSW